VREASSLSVLCIVGRALKTEKQKMSFGFWHILLGTDQPTCRGGGDVFLFRSEFFLDNMRVRIIFQNLTLGYDKNSESDYFFLSSTKIRIFVFNNVENQNIFFRKKT
jgi:hypothetical protein